MTEVLLRFAPSPTGYLHVGNARVALINWLFARQAGGRLLLRMDDTEVERSRADFAEAIQMAREVGYSTRCEFAQRERRSVGF